MTRAAALVFDLDQTLFDRQRALDEWIASHNLGNGDQARLRRWDQNGYGDRENFFAEVGALSGNEIDHRSFVSSLLRFIQPDRTLINRLKQLRATYSIAILTNGGSWTQLTKIRSLCLDEVFPRDRIFVSSEIGFDKPDPSAFDFVANALGVPARECLYFGDSVRTDIIAARTAGWRARHVRGPSELQQHLVRLRDSVTC